jgi:putative acetyltransferase
LPPYGQPMKTVSLRLAAKDDAETLRDLYPRAFPDEDLLPLLGSLLDGSWPVLSLVAVSGSGICGHIAFTLCAPDAEGKPQAALLAPLAVAPPMQRQRLGTRLVQAGLKQLQGPGVRQVFVLGDPEYYRRFGFLPEQSILPPYPMPPAYAEAWQSVLLPGAPPLAPGPLPLPQVWMQPSLWLP